MFDFERAEFSNMDFYEYPLIIDFDYQASAEEISELLKMPMEDHVPDDTDLLMCVSFSLKVYGDFDYKLEFFLEEAETGKRFYGTFNEVLRNANTLTQLVPAEQVKELWDAFGDVPIDNHDLIETQWLQFEKGTNRFDVWEWFERMFKVSVKELMEG